MKKPMVIALSLSMVYILFACRTVNSGPGAGITNLSVSIGQSVSRAKKAYNHNMTVDALKSGQTEYKVYAASGEAYTIKLSEKNVEDILSGSTAIVQTTEGSMKVKIGSKRPKPVRRSTGW